MCLFGSDRGKGQINNSWAGFAIALRHLLLAVSILFSCNGFAGNSLIAIDVGHSKSHPGTTSARGIPEFVFNLSLAKIIQSTLSGKTNSLLVGDDGTMVDLQKRTEMAASANSTFFLSVHHDSAQPKYFQQWQWQGVLRNYSDTFTGFSLFVSRKNVNPSLSLNCATHIGASLKRLGMHPALHHAEAIAGESRQWADKDNGVYYFDDLIVLKTSTSPAVLLEAGVIVNRNEETSLADDGTRRQIARAVSEGLTECHAIN